MSKLFWIDQEWFKEWRVNDYNYSNVEVCNIEKCIDYASKRIHDSQEWGDEEWSNIKEALRRVDNKLKKD